MINQSPFFEHYQSLYQNMKTISQWQSGSPLDINVDKHLPLE